MPVREVAAVALSRKRWIGWLMLGLLAVSCGGPAASSQSDTRQVAPSTSVPRVKRIIIGTGFEPDLRPSAGSRAGFVTTLVNTGLTVLGDQRMRRPRLAEAVPSIENGQWKLL